MRWIQGIISVTLVYTPGYFALAHPMPQLTMPIWVQVAPVPMDVGPPESPWGKTIFMFLDIFFIVFFVANLRCRSPCPSGQRTSCGP